MISQSSAATNSSSSAGQAPSAAPTSDDAGTTSSGADSAASGRAGFGQVGGALRSSNRSFSAFGFGSGGSGGRRSSQVEVQLGPGSGPSSSGPSAGGSGPSSGGGAPDGSAAVADDTPQIRKYKKKFSSEVLCAALWGVNLLIGTESGLQLLDRHGQGKVYQLISWRKFQHMEVLEGQNILVTISGKKNRVRVYYLSWLRAKILKTEGIDKKNGWINVGEQSHLQGAIHFKIGNNKLILYMNSYVLMYYTFVSYFSEI